MIASSREKERYNKHVVVRFIAAALLVLFFASCATATKDIAAQLPRNPEWAMPVAVEGVPNLHKINDNLYRSAQPSQVGMQNLEKMGVKTIINLRDFHDDKDEVVGTNIRRIDIQMTAWKIEDEKVIAALKQINNKEDGPYLIHCMHGADRTGVVSAMYRILHDNWDKQKAIDEMKNGNYGFHSVWTNIVDYIANVDVEKMRTALK